MPLLTDPLIDIPLSDRARAAKFKRMFCVSIFSVFHVYLFIVVADSACGIRRRIQFCVKTRNRREKSEFREAEFAEFEFRVSGIQAKK